MQLLTWVTLQLGRPIGRLFLYPICLYFWASSKDTNDASRYYLTRVLGRPASVRDVLRHYHAFASTIHDRVYLFSGRYRCFDLHMEGAEVLENAVKQGRGSILLGSHLGSFELLRVLGLFEKKLPITVLMHESRTSNLNSVLYGLDPNLRSRVISPGAPGTMLAIKEKLDQGELVGILADRVFYDEEKTVSVHFLGEDVPFPEGPWRLAAMLNVPVVLFFGLYQGGRRYTVHFELLAEAITLGRGRRSDEIQLWVQRYVARLEHYCRLAPYNWFNFYELSHISHPFRTDSFHTACPAESRSK